MSDDISRLTVALADRYRLERELGAGGMATVYLARDLKHDRDVALKVLRPELGAVLGSERFLAEIKITARLDHPHILTLIDSGANDGFLYYVLPLVRGESLRDKLNREKQLGLDEALAITKQVAGALDYAHRQGVIHRDIKPENILLQEGEAMLADFGIALAVKEAGGSRLTETGLSLGTPQYMSPEQATGDRTLDARSDVYSLGAVLYEMLAGEPPVTGPTAQAMIAKLMTERPTRLRVVRDTVPVGVETAVAKALAKTPADRFPNAAAFATALLAGGRSAESGRRRLAPIGWLVLAGLLAGAVGLAVYLRGGATSVAIDSIVVLPFENRSNDPDADYLSDGITESISNSLTQLSNLKVIPTSVAFHYKGKETNPQQVGHELKVTAVLVGRVAQRGDSLTVSVELDDVRQGKQLWGAQYNRKLADLLAVQRDIADEVSQRLRAEVSGADQQKMRSGSTDNPEAYQLYLKGNYYASRFTKDGFRKGIDYLNQALAVDSNYALAYGGLAFNYMNSEDWFWPPKEAAPKAKAAARRALAIDETSASAHLALAMVAQWYDWDWPTAEREFLRAIELAPNDPRPGGFYTWLLANLGRHDEAIAEARRAQQLDPVSAEANFFLGSVLVYAHQYDQAIDQLRTVVDLDPAYWFGYDFLGRAYEQMGRMPEAITAYQKALELEKDNAENWSHLGHVYAVSGKRGEAEKIITYLRETSAHSYVAPYNVALIYAGLGNKDSAFAWLDRAYDERSSLLALYMSTDSRWDRIRGDSRFADLARRVGLPNPSVK